MSDSARLPIVVLISGSGSNLQALIDSSQNGAPFEVVAVISNRDDAYGLERARSTGITTATLPFQGFESREAYDSALQQLIDGFKPELVVLAGFMRILTDDFVDHYSGRMVNIHPSLLPRHRGLHTHARAIEAGDREHGATVHFVTPELDAGPIIIQAEVPVLNTDTPEQLAARVLEQEHRIYPQAVSWFAEGRLTLDGNRALLDGQPIR